MLLLLALLSACSSPPQQAPYAGVKVGKPYQVYGHWYEPSYEEHYDEIGMASWYGPGFHGGKTATGEKYDQFGMTAAHRTLPLPSIVRVTNLNNGRSVLVRVNDRGPFAHNRIIDLSKTAATKLDIIRTGTSKVRVQFLDKETREYVQNVQRSGTQYAMQSLTGVNPELAGAREDELNKPRYHEVPYPSSMSPPQTLVVANNQQADPLPAHVTVAPKPRLDSRSAESDPNEEPDPNANTPSGIFSVVDDAHAESRQPASPASRPVTSAFSSPAGSGFFVQAGTFGVKENANRLLEKLSSFGASQIMEVMTQQRKFYRVMLGPFNAQNDARNMLSKLASIGISDARIIRN